MKYRKYQMKSSSHISWAELRTQNHWNSLPHFSLTFSFLLHFVITFYFSASTISATAWLPSYGILCISWLICSINSTVRSHLGEEIYVLVLQRVMHTGRVKIKQKYPMNSNEICLCTFYYEWVINESNQVLFLANDVCILHS